MKGECGRQNIYVAPRENLCTPPATRRNVEVAPDGGGRIGKYALSQWLVRLAEAGAPTEAGGGFS